MEEEKKTTYIENTEISTLMEDEEKIIRNAGVYNDIEPEILEMEVPELNQKLPIDLSSFKWFLKLKMQIVNLFKTIIRGNKETQKE